MTIAISTADSEVLYSAKVPFHIFEDLYYPSSKILSALQGGISPSEVQLKPDDPETMILMAELSFCIVSKWNTVASYLLLEDCDIENFKEAYCYSNSPPTVQQEAAFQVMLTWLERSEQCHTNLQRLIDAFKSIGVTIGTQKLSQNMYVHNHKDKNFHQVLRGSVAELSRRVASRRKFIGRLLGMTENDIASAASRGGSESDRIKKNIEETIAILDWWATINGYGATLSKLENVIYAVHEHSGHKLEGVIYFLTASIQTGEE